MRPLQLYLVALGLSIQKTKQIVFNIVGGLDMGLKEISKIPVSHLRERR
jgi:hypothetical protein